MFSNSVNLSANYALIWHQRSFFFFNFLNSLYILITATSNPPLTQLLPHLPLHFSESVAPPNWVSPYPGTYAHLLPLSSDKVAQLEEQGP